MIVQELEVKNFFFSKIDIKKTFFFRFFLQPSLKKTLILL
jgi:hypothetical protein